MTSIRNSADLTAEAAEQRRRRIYKIDAALLLAFIALLLIELFSLVHHRAETSAEYSSEISIRATSEANYGYDLNGFLIPPFDEQLIEQLIADIPATGSPEDRIATFQVGLLTPVATMTHSSTVPSPTKTASPSPVASSSSTPVWTATPRITPTSAATGTTPPLLPTLPPLLPTNPPIPTIPPIVPTLPPLLPTSLPLPTLPNLPLLP